MALYFVVLSHGKLDLRFFFMAEQKSVWICCTYQWPKSPRKIICHEFWRNRFVYLQTHLLMQAIATANKQLLSVVRDCSFEIREGGRTIWGEGHKISNIVFGGFKIYNTRFGGLQIFLHKIVRI